MVEEGYSKAMREIKCIKRNAAKLPIIRKTSLWTLRAGSPYTKLYVGHTKTFDMFIIAFSGVF